ncbi:hypothetical protein ACIQBJ_14390 [Kitasatospora sp. NPDC088391]|uniref:hypothetical protein n=1 Tax=Kitasatospora sp. NPDC088391 TaxID=3364074 RepID=UPI0038280257
MSSSSSTRYASTELRLRTVGGAVAVQVWPLLALAGLLLGAALLWRVRSGDGVPAAMAWLLLAKPAALGLVAPFVLHECAHALVLKRVRTVTHLILERTAWRTSLVPEGILTPRQSAAVALAGPLSCAAVGAVLHLTALDRPLSWWYLAHLVLLLPPFGDGRALWQALRAPLIPPPC